MDAAGSWRRLLFPGHWSMLLGLLSLGSLIVSLVTGLLLFVWYDPSSAEVIYTGSYAPLRGLEMSAAYQSTLEISFDIRGGLLVRQMHHWSAMVFIASMLLHLIRVFLTGGFRKPRRLNWVVGVLLLLVVTAQAFVGHSLPDDLISGSGLRVTDGVVKSVPVVGTYLSFLIFGGEFPGNDIIGRLHLLHVLVIPLLILALVALHLVLVLRHGPTEWPRSGRRQRTTVGGSAKSSAVMAGGLVFIVAGVITMMGALLRINPVWEYGPYDPAQASNGSQPDWYLAPLEGLLRIMPGWETEAFGYTITWAVLVPGVIVPGALVTVVVAYPFVEAWLTGDRRTHHVLQRPRDTPVRSGVLMALVTFYGLAWVAAGDDVLAFVLHLDVMDMVSFLRVAVFVGPVVAFSVTRRICLGLQRRDREWLQHGKETGVIEQSVEGGYSERHHLPGSEAAPVMAAIGGHPPSGPDDHGDESPTAALRG